MEHPDPKEEEKIKFRYKRQKSEHRKKLQGEKGEQKDKRSQHAAIQ